MREWGMLVTGQSFERPSGIRGWLRPWRRHSTRAFVVRVEQVEDASGRYDFVGTLRITDAETGDEVSRRTVYFEDINGWRALALHDLNPVMLGDTHPWVDNRCST